MKVEEPEQDQNVEYVSEQLDVKGSVLEAFSDVFARFQLPPDTHTVRITATISHINANLLDL